MNLAISLQISCNKTISGVNKNNTTYQYIFHHITWNITIIKFIIAWTKNDTSNLLVRTYTTASTIPIKKYPNINGKSKCIIEKNNELINILQVCVNLRVKIFMAA